MRKVLCCAKLLPSCSPKKLDESLGARLLYYSVTVTFFSTQIGKNMYTVSYSIQTTVVVGDQLLYTRCCYAVNSPYVAETFPFGSGGLLGSPPLSR